MRGASRVGDLACRVNERGLAAGERVSSQTYPDETECRPGSYWLPGMPVALTVTSRVPG